MFPGISNMKKREFGGGKKQEKNSDLLEICAHCILEVDFLINKTVF